VGAVPTPSPRLVLVATAMKGIHLYWPASTTGRRWAFQLDQ